MNNKTKNRIAKGLGYFFIAIVGVLVGLEFCRGYLLVNQPPQRVVYWRVSDVCDISNGVKKGYVCMGKENDTRVGEIIYRHDPVSYMTDAMSEQEKSLIKTKSPTIIVPNALLDEAGGYSAQSDIHAPGLYVQTYECFGPGAGDMNGGAGGTGGCSPAGYKRYQLILQN